MNSKLELILNVSLSAQEVDLMSVLAVGELSKINEDIISGYIQGVIERVIIEPTQVMITSDMPLILGAKAGYSGSKLSSYVRGWNQVGNRDDLYADKNENLGLYTAGFDNSTNAKIVASSAQEAEQLFFEHVGINSELDFDDGTCELNVRYVSGDSGNNVTPKFLGWLDED